MRALQPDRSGAVVRGGIASAYDVYGDGNETTVLLLPTWTIAHAAHWKMQIPVLARRHRVITMDGRGNGRSDRPRHPAAYTTEEYVADAVAVLDETATERAVVMGVSSGGPRAVALAVAHPDRVLGAVLIGPALHMLGPANPRRATFSFTDELGTDEGWALFNQHAWRRDYRRFAEFFWSTIFPEPHSTKAIEDGVEWALDTDAETLIATVDVPGGPRNRDEQVAALAGVTCPVLVVHGDRDEVVPVEHGIEARADHRR